MPLRALTPVLILMFSLASQPAQQAARPSVDPVLAHQIITSRPLAMTRVVISFLHAPTSADLRYLKSLGVRGGTKLRELPIVLTAVNQSQFDALPTRSNIASLYGNRTFKLLNHKSRAFIGVEALRRDQEVTTRLGGVPSSGHGGGVAYVDTGIDATHPDLQIGRNVVQNVMVPAAELTGTDIPPDYLPPFFLADPPYIA